MHRIGLRIGPAALVLAVVLTGCSATTAGDLTRSPGTGDSAGASGPAPTASLPGPAPTGSAKCGSSDPYGSVYSRAKCDIDAPSLAGNLLGDEPVITAYILTPTGYASTGIRYPVVYVLAGYTDSGADLAGALGSAHSPANGGVSPIIVVACGVNALGGGFYVNSSVSGNWEDAITKDVVGYVDGHYPIIARAASRAIAGHSMGGFGALSIAMRHPELFSAVFAESPGLFDKDGATDRLADPEPWTASCSCTPRSPASTRRLRRRNSSEVRAAARPSSSSWPTGRHLRRTRAAPP